MVPEKSQQQISLLKKRFASQPEQSFVSCQDGKCIFWGSERSLSAMTQHWRKSEPSPPLKSSSKIIKVFAIFFNFFFSSSDSLAFTLAFFSDLCFSPLIIILKPLFFEDLFHFSVPTEANSPYCLLTVAFSLSLARGMVLYIQTPGDVSIGAKRVTTWGTDFLTASLEVWLASAASPVPDVSAGCTNEATAFCRTGKEVWDQIIGFQKGALRYCIKKHTG